MQKDAKNFEPRGDEGEFWYRLHLKDLAKLVLEKAKTLNDRQQAMFQMRLIDGKPHDEIADKLNISLRTSYRLENQVRTILQKLAT